MAKNSNISIAVIRRLPRYYRYLTDLKDRDIQRISSRELAEIMDLTASQIRQDLNCFGGFGQQGYGYHVETLLNEVGKILGIDKGYKIILFGAGNLGRAIALHIDFDRRGFKLCGIFDKNPAITGQEISGHLIHGLEDLEEFCKKETPTVAALCIPKEAAEELVPQLVELGIRAFWNFSHYDINLAQYPNVISENVHLGDSMMTLCYQVKESESK